MQRLPAKVPHNLHDRPALKTRRYAEGNSLHQLPGQGAEAFTQGFVSLANDHEGLRVHLADDGLDAADLGTGYHAVQHRPVAAGESSGGVQDGHAALHVI